MQFCGRLPEGLAHGVRVAPQCLGRQICQGLEHPGRGCVGILVGIEFHHVNRLGLKPRCVPGHLFHIVTKIGHSVSIRLRTEIIRVSPGIVKCGFGVFKIALNSDRIRIWLALKHDHCIMTHSKFV